MPTGLTTHKTLLGYLHTTDRIGIGLKEIVDMLPGRLARTRSMITFATVASLDCEALLQVPLAGGPPAAWALVPIADKHDDFEKMTRATFNPNSGQQYRGIGLIFPISELTDHREFPHNRILIACDDLHTVIATRTPLQRSYQPITPPPTLEELFALLGRAHHAMRDATRP